MSDQELWSQLKQGDDRAFAVIYEAHAEALFQYGLRFSQQRALIEDHVHDLFIYLWKNRATLSDTDSIRRYLLVSLRRRIFKGAKRQQRVTDLQENVGYDFLAEGAIDEQIIREEEEAIHAAGVKQALARLSARQKEVIYLKYFENYSYDDICQIMDISYQSVRNLTFQSIKSLRKLMSSLIPLLIFLWP